MSQLHHHIHCLQSFPDTALPQYSSPGLVAGVVTLSSSALTKFSAYNQEKNGATGHLLLANTSEADIQKTSKQSQFGHFSQKRRNVS